MDIPVYLFTGFLESGKTKFIQETLCDKRFNNGESTLLLVCEEGIEEYNPSAFSGDNVYIHNLSAEELSADFLEKLRKEHKAQRVIIEYNGMWQLQNLFENLPQKWIIAQEFMFADSKSFVSYNQNMRSLVVDKLNTCELVVFNRFDDNVDQMALHKIVRGVNTRANIAYENSAGDVVYDDIEDPLPFDTEADVIVLNDEHYALWYRDLSDNLQKYNGKTIKFKGITAKNRSLPKNSFVIGRPVMTCCADDIQFAGLICDYAASDSVGNQQWLMIEAKIIIEKHKAYGKQGPVLHINSVAVTDPPAQPVAEFY